MNRETTTFRPVVVCLFSKLMLLISLFPATQACFSNELGNPKPVQTSAPEPKPDVFQLGIDLCDQGKFAEALPLHRELVKTHPFYARGWLGLGWSLHYTDRFEEAIPAYLKALELGALDPHRIHLEIARCHAALGKKAEALQSLEKAMQAGLPNLARLRSDKRLDAIRDEPKFKELAAVVDTSKMTRVQGRRYDLDLLVREVKRLHYDPYRAWSRQEFEAEVASIRAAIPTLTDDEFAVRIMKFMRRLGDGHTYAEAVFQQSGTQRALPVQFGWFEEGLFIGAVKPENEDLLWARVLKFDDAPVERVATALEAVVSRDNAMGLKSVGPRLMRQPQLLKALGVARNSSEIDLTVIDRGGKTRTVKLKIAESVPNADWVVKPSDHAGDLPLFVRNRTDFYRYQYFPETKLLYFQYNACADKDDESVEDFAKRMFDFIDRTDVQKMVVDLRWNGGGNMFVSRPLLEGLCAARKINQPGRLFVVAGRRTFSAAMIFAAQLERYTHAVFVGEPTGSSPNFVGETNFLELPHGKIDVSISNLYWQTSHAKDFRTWIAPRIYVPPTFESYRAGRDPALEAIMAWR